MKNLYNKGIVELTTFIKSENLFTFKLNPIIGMRPMSIGLKKLVLDVLKLHKPPLTELVLNLSELPGVEGVNIVSVTVDRETETIKITIEGNLNYEAIRENLISNGCSIHSVDIVWAGKRIIEEG